MRLFRPFFLLRLVYPEAIFRVRTTEKELCLTFDDGPHPDTTPHILEILEARNVKAVFFCSGREAEKYPELVNLILLKGHLIGNHGYIHLNGWKTNVSEYIENAARAELFTSPGLFRPPYGRIRLAQYCTLVKKYRIVFWDLMPYDFDEKIDSKRVLNILKKKIRPGSVIVLHDKTSSLCLSFLEEFIKYAEDDGYKFVTSPLSGKE
jgi:peptidoglycan/xylan/chitin deacetylase (PgdA/CDA1 family)